jgi:hypothetical protein
MGRWVDSHSTDGSKLDFLSNGSERARRIFFLAAWTLVTRCPRKIGHVRHRTVVPQVFDKQRSCMHILSKRICIVCPSSGLCSM